VAGAGGSEVGDSPGRVGANTGAEEGAGGVVNARGAWGTGWVTPGPDMAGALTGWGPQAGIGGVRGWDAEIH